MQMGPEAAIGIGFFVIWLLMMVGMVAGYVVMLVALWRAMRAHETIAQAVKEIAQDIKIKSQGV